MASYVIMSIVSGILFGVMDGLINANPIAQRLYLVYLPISKKSINFIAGIAIDLLYGFVLAGIFLLLYHSLPGASGLVKGLSLGILTWFLRVVMQAASQWIMYTVPVKTFLYTMITGLIEMVVLGIIYGLFLKPIS